MAAVNSSELPAAESQTSVLDQVWSEACLYRKGHAYFIKAGCASMEAHGVEGNPAQPVIVTLQ